jgi:hypothetical protein
MGINQGKHFACMKNAKPPNIFFVVISPIEESFSSTNSTVDLIS